MSPRYPPEIRQEIVDLARGGRTPSELAREYEPSVQTIRDWIAEADRGPDIPRDIAPHTQSGRIGRQHATLLAMASKAAGLGGWIVDLHWGQIYWSDEVYAIHEVSRTRSITLEEGLSYYAPEWRGRIHEVFTRCATDGTPYDEEMQIITANGRRVWVRAVGEAVRDDSGQITQVQGAFQDITDRKQVEEELRRLAARFNNTLESITDAFFTLDRKWRFTYVNREAERLLRRKRTELLGKLVWREFKGGIDPVIKDACRRAMREQRTVHLERYYAPLEFWAEVHAYPSEEGLAVYFRDISERKQAEADIQFFAMYDPLTRLPNRRLLLDRLQQAMAVCAGSRQKGAVLFLDLDNFKTLNDTAGHYVGDQLLQQVASRLSAAMRKGDMVGRFGGDEFVIILEGLSDKPDEAALQAEKVGEKILAMFQRPFRVAAYTHHSTVSIGIMLFGKNRKIRNVDDVMKRADLAMYQAKARGRNTLCLFDPDMQATVNARVALETAMREGLKRREFLPYFQPQVDSEGRLIGAEALARWQHPQRGLVSPAEFIPVAEATGLILPLGRYMLESVCAQLASWARHPETAELKLAVNISARQFLHPKFVSQVLEVIDQAGADPRMLRLELTESLLLEDVDDTIATMSALKEAGVGFSLDDFGTGYSSLYYLKRLPLDQLKIDQRFIGDVLSNANDAAIVRTMVVLAQSLGLDIISEGVETEAIRNFLADNDCYSYQGYFFGHPVPMEQFEALACGRARKGAVP